MLAGELDHDIEDEQKHLQSGAGVPVRLDILPERTILVQKNSPYRRKLRKKKELGDGETHKGDGVDVVVETIGSKAHYASVNSKAEKSQDECSQKPHHGQGARPISPERHVEKKRKVVSNGKEFSEVFHRGVKTSELFAA